VVGKVLPEATHHYLDVILPKKPHQSLSQHDAHSPRATAALTGISHAYNVSHLRGCIWEQARRKILRIWTGAEHLGTSVTQYLQYLHLRLLQQVCMWYRIDCLSRTAITTARPFKGSVPLGCVSLLPSLENLANVWYRARLS